MYLAEMSIKNFRRLSGATLRFVPGLNVLVGPNNIGKTAVVDALRALLAGADDPYLDVTRAELFFALPVLMPRMRLFSAEARVELRIGAEAAKHRAKEL